MKMTISEFNLKAVVLEKKKNVLIGRAVPDQEISLYMQKYRLRVEYILKMYEEKSEDKVTIRILSFTKFSISLYMGSRLPEMEKPSHIHFCSLQGYEFSYLDFLNFRKVILEKSFEPDFLT